jgi:hypothetical protein
MSFKERQSAAPFFVLKHIFLRVKFLRTENA